MGGRGRVEHPICAAEQVDQMRIGGICAQDRQAGRDSRGQRLEVARVEVEQRPIAHQSGVDAVEDALDVDLVGVEPLGQAVGELFGLGLGGVGRNHHDHAVEIRKLARVTQVVAAVARVGADKIVLTGAEFKPRPRVPYANDGQRDRRREDVPRTPFIQPRERAKKSIAETSRWLLHSRQIFPAGSLRN